MTDEQKAAAMRAKLSLAARLLYVAADSLGKRYESAHYAVNILSQQSDAALALVYDAINEVR